jgi:hypothetical protein
MNILVYALSKSDEIDRLKLFLSGSIKSNNHNFKITFIGEGPKPHIVHEDFEWIDCSRIPFSSRHIHGLQMAMNHDNIDYVIFCDNDVMIDIDYFIENEGKSKENEPTIWTSSPGMGGDDRLYESIIKNASKFIKDKDIKLIYMGFCTTVINRPLINKIKDDISIIESVKKISEEIWRNAFVVDVQISILSFLIGSSHIQGHQCGSYCWPAYMASPVLNKKGKLWHIHGIGRNSFINNESLSYAIKNGPFDKQKLPTMIYKNLYKKFNVGKIINNKFISNWGWAAWANASVPMQNNAPTSIKTFSRRNGKINILSNIEYDWYACSNGFTAYNKDNIIDFFWYNSKGDLFGIFRETTDNMLDGSMVVLNRI